FAPAKVIREPLEGGGFVLRSPLALGEIPRSAGAMLVHWAREAPARVFLAERDAAGAWVKLTYAETLVAGRSLAQGLLDRGLGPTRPLMLLSHNAIDHALLQLAGMHAGIPVAPISPAYSLLSRDHAKLRALGGILGPGAVYAADGAAYRAAIAALD